MGMWFTRPAPQLNREQIIIAVDEVAKEMGITSRGVLIAGITIATEVGTTNPDTNTYGWWCFANRKDPQCLAIEHDAEGDDGYSSGYYQQQAPKGANWGWGGLYGDAEGAHARMDLKESTRLFFDAMLRLPYPYESTARTPGKVAQDIQRSAFPDRYDKRVGEVLGVIGRALNVEGKPSDAGKVTSSGPWTGDPVWIADMLRDEGLKVVEFPGWRQRGHGDFGDLWGVVTHHTGSDFTPPSEIAYGFAHLPGPLSQIHLARDGTVTLVAVGVAWHAGEGSYPGLPTNNANWHTIGIEAQNNGGGTPGQPHRSSWPDVQYDAYVRICAAICRRLGVGSERVISHQEWAGRVQGKWDPGAINMGAFRSDIADRIGTVGDEDEMAGWTPDKVDRAMLLLEATAGVKRPSKSPLRHLGEGNVNTCVGFAWTADGLAHANYVYTSALAGHEPSLELLEEVASALGNKDYPDRQEDAELAELFLKAIRIQRAAIKSELHVEKDF